MIIHSKRSTSLSFFSFCLISILLASSHVNGQNDPQQPATSKVNSININNKSVTNGDRQLEAPASDSVVIKNKYSNLNSKYETQSSVTSSTAATTTTTTTASIGLYSGSKKSKYKFLGHFLSRKLILIKFNCCLLRAALHSQLLCLNVRLHQLCLDWFPSIDKDTAWLIV